MEKLIIKPEDILIKMQVGTLSFNQEALESIVVKVEKRYSNLVITEDMVKEAKTDMADLNKLAEAFNRKRIDTGKEFRKPLEDFETGMRDMQTRVLEAREKIRTQVANFENAVKEEKEALVREFYLEQVKAYNLDFINFEDVGLNITLSASLTALKNEVVAFVEKVVADLAVIETLENKERVLVEYYGTRDLAKAVTKVAEAVKLEELLKVPTAPVEVTPPKVVAPEIKAPEEIITVSFKVTGTREQLRAVKNFLQERGIIYE